jgi:hypothetical protein
MGNDAGDTGRKFSRKVAKWSRIERRNAAQRYAAYMPRQTAALTSPSSDRESNLGICHSHKTRGSALANEITTGGCHMGGK